MTAVRDAFSNRIVGWRCSDRCDTDLVLGAVEYGIWTRDVRDYATYARARRAAEAATLRVAACRYAGSRRRT